MNKIALVFLILNSVFFPTLPSLSGEEEQKNAAMIVQLVKLGLIRVNQVFAIKKPSKEGCIFGGGGEI
tara:strand:+ start:520 stop:723 length:204 start_codon:yes stop_codon:yes gene_type:complete